MGLILIFFIQVLSTLSVLGLVTLEDLIETMLGEEIVDEKDLVVDLQKLTREPKRQKRPPG